MTHAPTPSAPAQADLIAVLESAEPALGISLSPCQRDQLLAYVALLGQWGKTYNLTAIRDPMAAMTQHVIDCLAVVAPLRRMLRDRTSKRVADVGAGAGLPGVVIAVAAPETTVTCVESVRKKAAFIRHASSALRLGNLATISERVEDIEKAEHDVVVSRAFSDLAQFVRMTDRIASRHGFWLAMKGKVPTEEIANLPETARAFHVEQLEVPAVTGERCLIWIHEAK